MSEALHFSVHLNCSIEHAFEVFTSRVNLWWPPGHRRFEGSTLTLEARAGGRFFESAASGEEAVLGEVLSCEPPNSISYTWHPGKITGPTLVKITFQQEQTQTLVQVEHSEGDSALGDQWPSRAVLFNKGWDAVLGRLREFISNNPT